MRGKLFLCMVVCAMVSGPAMAWDMQTGPDCAGEGSCGPASWEPSLGMFRGCDKLNDTVVREDIYPVCTCVPVDTLTLTSFNCLCTYDEDCHAQGEEPGKYYCAQEGDSGTPGLCYDCVKCSGCSSDTDFVAGKTGYEEKIIRKCDCRGQCMATAGSEYRCASGYYGKTTDGEHGCTPCPPSDGGTVMSTPGKNSDKQSCYVLRDAPFGDDTGDGKYVDDCYYVEQ